MAGLEAKLVITAEDHTKAAFAEIMERVGKIHAMAAGIDRAEQTAKRAISSTEDAIARAGRALESSAAQMERAARTMERAAAATRHLKGVGSIDGAAGLPSVSGKHRRWHANEAVHMAEVITSERGMKRLVARGGHSIPVIAGPAAVAGVVAYEGGKFVAEKRGERVHEQVREDIAGMNPAEREAADRKAALLTSRYPQVTQTDVMHMLRNARSVTGNYEDAASMADDLIRTRIVAQAAKRGRNVEEDFDKLVKGMEEYGVTQDPKAFREAMRRVQKVIAVEGDTLTADQIYQSFKYTRQALPGTSQSFMLGTAPGLYQAMGGSSFGNALSSFNQAIVQGRMSQRSLQLAMDLGLIEKQDVNLEHGHPKSVKTALEGGHGFKDWQVAKTDPDQWIWGRLSKALTNAKITDPNQITQITSTLFGNRMAGDLVSKIITQRARLEKNRENLARAPDDPAERIMAGDPIAAWKGVENSFSNLAAAIPVSGTAVTGALNTVAAAINDAAARMQGVTTDHARIAQNKEAFNIASGQDLSKMSPTELAPLKAAALTELKQKLLASRLELKGVQDEQATQAKMGWLEYIRSSRDKVADSMLPFRAKNLTKEISEIEAVIDRLSHLGEKATIPSIGADPEHDRILRAAGAYGATLSSVSGAAPSVEVSGTIQGTVQGKIDGEIRVVPGSELVSAVAKINAITAKVDALAKVANGPGVRSPATGTSMPEATPGGRTGTNRP